MYEITIKTSKTSVKIVVEDINDAELENILENNDIIEVRLEKIRTKAMELIKK